MKIYKDANEINLTMDEVSECKLIKFKNVFGMEPMYKVITVDISQIGTRNCYKIVISKTISFNDSLESDLLLNNIVEFTDAEVKNAERTMYRLVDHLEDESVDPDSYSMSFTIK